MGCLEADADPRLACLSDVLGAYTLWVVTSHAVRNNPRLRAVKEALVEMIQAAAPEVRRQPRDVIAGVRSRRTPLRRSLGVARARSGFSSFNPVPSMSKRHPWDNIVLFAIRR
jgi:hypothetical protein